MFLSVLRVSVVIRWWDEIHHGGTENTEKKDNLNTLYA